MLGCRARGVGRLVAEKREERQIAVENFFMPSSENFLVVIFFPTLYIACMSLAVYTMRLFSNLYLSFSAAEFAYTIKLKIAVCLKLSTVK